MPEPKDVADVHRFMGMVNFVGRFSPHTYPNRQSPSEICWKMTTAWHGTNHKEKHSWTQRKNSAQKLCWLSTAHHQRQLHQEMLLPMDFGRVLTQKQPDGWWRLVFISRSLTTTESSLHRLKRKPLAVTWACERLSGYLRGIDLILRTDHKPLITLFKLRALYDIPPRILWFWLQLLRFSFDINMCQATIR